MRYTIIYEYLQNDCFVLMHWFRGDKVVSATTWPASMFHEFKLQQAKADSMFEFDNGTLPDEIYEQLK